MRHTFHLGFAARTVTGAIIILPDAVAEAQWEWDGKVFPARREDGRRIRAQLLGDHYGLWTTGTGDPLVRIL